MSPASFQLQHIADGGTVPIAAKSDAEADDLKRSVGDPGNPIRTAQEDGSAPPTVQLCSEAVTPSIMQRLFPAMSRP